MPVYRRYFGPGQLQFITSSTYRRVKLFESERFRRDFVDVLRQLREPLVLVSFAMGIHSSRRSFPRKRESSPTTAHFQRFAE